MCPPDGWTKSLRPKVASHMPPLPTRTPVHFRGLVGRGSRERIETKPDRHELPGRFDRVGAPGAPATPRADSNKQIFRSVQWHLALRRGPEGDGMRVAIMRVAMRARMTQSNATASTTTTGERSP